MTTEAKGRGPDEIDEGQGVGVCRNEHQDAAVERSDRHAVSERGGRTRNVTATRRREQLALRAWPM